MPKLGLMAQISRPFQIALVALLALAMLMATWFMVLHRSSGTASSGTSSPSAASSPSGSSAAASASTPQRVARPPRSGAAHDSRATAVGGTPAAGSVHRVAGAVRTHPHASAGASASLSAAARPHTRTHASAGAASSTASKATPVTARRTPPTRRGSAAAAPSHSTPTLQSVVAGELKQGRVVLLLFWNPHSTDDVAVDGQLQAVAHKLGRRVAVHTAYASQVNSFGSITRDIQVYQTPTLLIVNPHGQVTTMTGYTDAFAIEQTIAEARG
jgi:hypothetical protein